jgi:hypothetical protein
MAQLRFVKNKVYEFRLLHSIILRPKGEKIIYPKGSYVRFIKHDDEVHYRVCSSAYPGTTWLVHRDEWMEFARRVEKLNITEATETRKQLQLV